MRSQTFASVCLFGADNNSSISGIWVWRGHGLAFEVCTPFLCFAVPSFKGDGSNCVTCGNKPRNITSKNSIFVMLRTSRHGFEICETFKRLEFSFKSRTNMSPRVTVSRVEPLLLFYNCSGPYFNGFPSGTVYLGELLN